MIDPAVDGFATIPSAIVVVLIVAHALRVRHGAALVVAYVSFSVVYGPVRALLDPTTRIVTSILVTCAQFALFVAYPSHRRFVERFVITLASFGATAVAECVASVLFVALGGPTETEPSAYLLAYCATRLLHLVVLAALLGAVDLFATRRLDGAPNDRTLWLFALFPVAQFLLLATLLYAKMGASPFWHTQTWFPDSAYLWFAALCALCVVVDAAFFRVLDRSIQAQADRVRADLLQDSIDQELERSERLMQDIEETARLRHDLANHLSVVRALCDEGDRDAARGHVLAMIRMMEEREGGARVAVSKGAQG